MKYYIVWYKDIDGDKEYENYVILHEKDIKDARKAADEMFGEYVISVEPYNP